MHTLTEADGRDAGSGPSAGVLATREIPPVAALALFLVGAVAAYSNALASFFASDDFGIVWAAADSGFAVVLRPFVGLFFRPLSLLTLAIDHSLWGLNPVGYHVTNVLLHGVNAWLVFMLGRHLMSGRRGGPVGAALGGFAFLVLPCHSEAVTWISGRCDVLATSCCLASLVFLLRFRRDGRRAALAGSVAFFVLGLLAKESALALPGVVLSLVVLDPGRETSLRRRIAEGWRPAALFVACLGPYVVLRAVAIGGLVGGYGASVHLRIPPAVVARNIVFYAGRTALPASRWAFDWLAPVSKVAWAFIGAVVLLAWLGGMVIERRRSQRRVVAWLFLAFLTSLLPVINLGVSPTDTQGERFLYLGSAFFCLAGAVALIDLFRPRTASLVLATAVLVGWVTALWRENAQWRAAGALARTIVGEVNALGTVDRVFLLVLPGDVRGAYVFRNGIREAVMLSCPNLRATGGALIASAAQVASDDRVSVSRSGRTITVRQETPNGGFTRADQTSFGFPTGTYEVGRFAQDEFVVTFTDLMPRDRIVYFSGGRLRIL